MRLRVYLCTQSPLRIWGVWGVDGAYTFYILNKYPIDLAVLADFNISDRVINENKKHSNLTLIEGNFGDKSVIDRIGMVDFVIMFDVLLHQVNPDWDEVLKCYSNVTNCFIIYNQQWTKTDKTVRLIDLGKKEYFKNVPHNENGPRYKALFDTPYEINPKYKCAWRDVTDVWQWGITDSNLSKKMNEYGFCLKFNKNYGHFGGLENFENHGFVFHR